MKELQEKYGLLVKEAGDLEAKDSKEWTEADHKRCADLPGEIAELKSKIEQRKALADAAAVDPAELVPTADPKAAALKMVETSKHVGDALVDLKESRELLKEFGAQNDELLLKTCEPTYQKAFQAYMVGKEDVADLKTLREAVGDSGGYLVPADILADFIKQEMPATAFLQRCRVIQMGLNPVVINRRTEAVTNRIQWTGETGTASLDEPTFNQVTIPVHEGTVPVEVSKSLMEDAQLAVDEALAYIADCLTYGLEDVMVNGNGVARPRGFLSGAGGTGRVGTVNVGNPMTADGVIELIGTLGPEYREGAMFLCNGTDVWTDLTQLKDSDGRYVGWLQSIDQSGLASARIPGGAGYPAAFTAAMPAAGSANNILAFGNWRKAYAAVQRLAVEIERWVSTKAESSRGVTGFTARLRYGGDVVAPWAAKIGVQL